MFCAQCKGPQTPWARVLYIANLLVIPLSLALVGAYLAKVQQDASLIVASRQKLADGLIDFGRTYAEYHSASRKLKLLSYTKDDKISADKLRDAVSQLDTAMSSFGAKLIPFEEFARRNDTYKNLKSSCASPLQKVWDSCFVNPYWVRGPSSAPGKYSESYFSQIQTAIKENCDNRKCNKVAAVQIEQIADDIYEAKCDEEKFHEVSPKSPECKIDKRQKLPDCLDFIWIHRELRRIVVQGKSKDPYECKDL